MFKGIKCIIVRVLAYGMFFDSKRHRKIYILFMCFVWLGRDMVIKYVRAKWSDIMYDATSFNCIKETIDYVINNPLITSFAVSIIGVPVIIAYCYSASMREHIKRQSEIINSRQYSELVSFLKERNINYSTRSLVDLLYKSDLNEQR